MSLSWIKVLAIFASGWLALFACPCANAETRDAPVLVGAIRWDGWFEGNPWEKNLIPEQWQYRLPFFADKSDTGVTRINGDCQEVMDAEIAYAKAGGLSYWAFCYYHPKSWPQADAYNYGWRRYLQSSHKADLNFCFILQAGSHLGPPEAWDVTVREFVRLFKEPTYQRVCGNRPLVYVYSCANLIPHFGTAAAAGEALRLLRAEAQRAGLGDPYIVAQVWPGHLHSEFLDALKFDALGMYSAQGHTGERQSFEKLTTSNQWYWTQYKATGRDVVPTVNSGWDDRPRAAGRPWYERGTPDEIARALGLAVKWVRGNPSVSPARTVLIYAWNEFDEGGWLCPTKAEGTARLDAMRAVIDREK